MIKQLSLFKCCTKCDEWLPNTLDYFYKQQNRCKKCTREYVKGNYARDPDRVKNYQKQYAIEHPEKIKQRKRSYYARNRMRLLEYSKMHYGDSREINRRAKRKYSRTDKGRWSIKIGKHKRRSAEGHWTKADIINQIAKQNQRCFWCSQYLDRHFHIDHIIPVSRHGTNWPSNIVISCHSCNESKCDKLPFQEWTPPKCLGR